MKSCNTDRRALIIGFGNVYRGDDAIGCLVAESLAVRLSHRGVDVLSGHQLTPELAADIAAAPLVIFIDASSRDAPGEINLRRIEPPASPPERFTHHLSPNRLLALTQQVYGSVPPAYLLSVGGEFFGYRAGLSDIVQRTWPVLVRRVEELIHA